MLYSINSSPQRNINEWNKLSTDCGHASSVEICSITEQTSISQGQVTRRILYSETSLIRSPMGLPKSDLNGEVTMLQGVKLHCRIQFGTENG